MKNFPLFNCAKLSARGALTITSVWLATGAQAADGSPIRNLNSLPVMQGAGVSVARSADLSQESTFSWLIDLGLQSHANVASNQASREGLLIDTETLQLNAELQWRFAPRWQASLNVGALRHSAGGLDSIIRRWHDAFGFTQGDRDAFADDQFAISYSNNSQQTAITQPRSGISDTQLSLGYQWLDSTSWQLASYVYTNLPTGSPAKLTGSNSVDYGMALAAASKSTGHYAWYGSASINRIGDERLFGIQTKDYFVSLATGVHWQPSDRWRWSAQLDGHSATFESQIEEISKSAWQLSLALELNKQWQLYIAEDLSVNRAADFSIGLNWRSGF